MTPAVREMLSRYNCETGQDYANALKEIIQEIALLGLWRAKFFEHAAFYGGTALRILYELDRFSEDIDFSLLKPKESFKFQPYMRAVQDELEALGFDVSIEERKKNVETAIESAFIKADTRKHLIKIQTPENISDRIPKTALLTVKLEIDTNPPGDFQTEVKTLLLPIPFSVNTFQLPDLFAGKIHAILMRNWKSRVKGRDYYDFVWYLARQVPVRLKHLEARLRQSGGWGQKKALNQEMLQTLLKEKFNSLDIAAAKRDVEPFLKDRAAVALWSRGFFIDLLERLKIV
ncbi:MAG: nucleotidyl transferase AbiEii/AbiGii toxin family protein [Deltaproteobacteria bacterium]|nr:nucleotidyl transferase AbiEii/AbiGii toxin family protein [Deltaproteobacteria bacterium]